jgi:hypothetical protein
MPDKTLNLIAKTYDINLESAKHYRKAIKLLSIRKGLLARKDYEEHEFQRENLPFLR